MMMKNSQAIPHQANTGNVDRVSAELMEPQKAMIQPTYRYSRVRVQIGIGGESKGLTEAMETVESANGSEKIRDSLNEVSR